MTFTRLLILVCICIVPCVSHAAVVISEVAWMGSTDSPNDEWIELHNDGSSPVSLDGWTLRDNRELSVELSGTLEGGTFAVLERTDDESAAGAAFLVYTGALPNTGATLYLYAGDGSLEDQVAGGENWENIGGDNESKATAQKTDAGWKTQSPTPGSAPSSIENDESETRRSETTQTQDVPNEIIELQLPDLSLSLEVSAPDIVYVHQPVVFDVVPAGLGKIETDSLSYTWNFGDLTTHDGKKVTHAFSYSGTYVTAVYATYGRHEQAARKTVTVLPVAFTLSFNTKGDVLLRNNAKYEVNVSGYTLIGAEKMSLPMRSIVLPDTTLTISHGQLGKSYTTAFLYDQKGELVATTEAREPALPKPQIKTATQKAQVIETIAEPLSEVSETPSNFSFTGAVAEVTHATTAEEIVPQAAAVAQAVPKKIPEDALPLLGLCGIVTVGIMAVFVGRKR